MPSGPCGRAISSPPTAATALYGERLGIPLQGHGTFSNSITIYFRADVARAPRRSQPERDLRLRPPPAGLLPVLEGGRRRFPARQHDDRRRRAARRPTSGGTPPTERCIDLVRDALGAPDLPVEVENVQRWNACAEWARPASRTGASSWSATLPTTCRPTGGFGGNTGVQDGHNLAWKLALVLEGRGRAGASRHLRRGASPGGAS